MAGTLRAEATLAAANLVYIVLLGVGGVVFPLTKFPAGARPVLELLPTGALSTGLRSVLQHGVGLPGRQHGHAGGLGRGGDRPGGADVQVGMTSRARPVGPAGSGRSRDRATAGSGSRHSSVNTAAMPCAAATAPKSGAPARRR